MHVSASEILRGGAGGGYKDIIQAPWLVRGHRVPVVLQGEPTERMRDPGSSDVQ